MKIFHSILAFTAVLIAAVSCEKAPQSPETAVTTLGQCKDFNINLDMTKAPKNGWAENDIINVWLSHSPVESRVPDLILTRVGERWVTTVKRPECPVSEKGSLACVYESSNDLSSYNHEWNETYKQNDYNVPSVNNSMTENTYANAIPQIVYTKDWITYTYNGTSLSANVTGWAFMSRTSFLIRNDDGNLTGNPNQYYLKVEHYNASSETWLPLGSIFGMYVAHNQYNGNPSVGKKVNGSIYSIGMSDSDGVVFYFDFAYFSNEDLRLTLNGPAFSGTAKTYTVNNMTINSLATDRCTGFSVNFSKFN